MTDLPPSAIIAALKVAPDGLFTAEIQRMLEAAAPLIAADAFTDGFTDGVAAEKQRIIELATEHERLYVPSGVPSFADRLTEGDTP